MKQPLEEVSNADSYRKVLDISPGSFLWRTGDSDATLIDSKY
jgi:hypothetical protein